MDEHRDAGEPSGLDTISIISLRTVYRQIPSFQQLSDTSPDLPTVLQPGAVRLGTVHQSAKLNFGSQDKVADDLGGSVWVSSS